MVAHKHLHTYTFAKTQRQKDSHKYKTHTQTFYVCQSLTLCCLLFYSKCYVLETERMYIHTHAYMHTRFYVCACVRFYYCDGRMYQYVFCVDCGITYLSVFFLSNSIGTMDDGNKYICTTKCIWYTWFKRIGRFTVCANECVCKFATIYIYIERESRILHTVDYGYMWIHTTVCVYECTIPLFKACARRNAWLCLPVEKSYLPVDTTCI